MRSALLLVTLAAACTVPDKFLADPDAGDDVPDADVDDDIPPETTLTVSPAALSNDGTPSFEFTSNEPGTFTCSVDGETEIACNSPYTRTVSDGAHTFAVRAIDDADNEDPSPAQYAWSSDTVAPGTTITTAPAAVDNSVTVTFEFIADEVGATFECSLGVAAFAACISGQQFGPLADGMYTFRVRAGDPSGNVDPSPAMHLWMLDSSTPDTTIDSGPTNGSTVATTTATFSFSSPDAGGGATFECQLDGGGFAVCASPRAYNSLTQVLHTFQVRVRDAGGNADPSPAQRMWTVDTTPPTTTINSAPTGAVSSTSAMITFSSNEATATFDCRLEPAPFAPCTSPVNLSSLPQGTRNFYVRAIDAALTPDASPALATWIVDTVAPDTSFASGPPLQDADGNATFDLSSDETPVTYQCATDAGGFASCTDPHTISVSDGMHTRWARATDAAGNTDTSYASFMWTADSTAPVVNITSGPVAGEITGPYNTFAWTVDDASATVTCSINNGVPLGCTSPFSFHAPEGAVSFKIEARDFASRTGTAERNWSIDCFSSSGPGAIAHFKFEESGQTQDVVNAVPGTNATLGANNQIEFADPLRMRPGRYGAGFRFRQVEGDFVNWSPVASSAAFTVELWFNPGADVGIANLFRTGDARLQLYTYTNPGGRDVVLQLMTTGGFSTPTLATTTTPGGWHHVIATHDGSSVTVWLDGVATTQAYTTTDPYSFALSRIGANQSNDLYDGTIDEVVVSLTRWISAEALPRYCPPPVQVPTCPASYVSVMGMSHKYREEAVTATWVPARDVCAADLPGYTNLFVPDSNAELMAVDTLFDIGNSWIGLTDATQEGTWVNVTGDTQTYFNWETGNPNGGTSQNCAQLSGQAEFRDFTCSQQSRYICECEGL